MRESQEAIEIERGVMGLHRSEVMAVCMCVRVCVCVCLQEGLQVIDTSLSLMNESPVYLSCRGCASTHRQGADMQCFYWRISNLIEQLFVFLLMHYFHAQISLHFNFIPQSSAVITAHATSSRCKSGTDGLCKKNFWPRILQARWPAE